MKRPFVTKLGFAVLITLAVLVHPIVVAAEIMPKVRVSTRRFVRAAAWATLLGMLYGFIYTMKFGRFVLQLNESTKARLLRKTTTKNVILPEPAPQKAVV